MSINNSATITNSPAPAVEVDYNGNALGNISEQIRANTDIVKRIDGRVRALEEKTTQLASVVKELNDFMRKQQKESFVIKGSK